MLTVTSQGHPGPCLGPELPSRSLHLGGPWDPSPALARMALTPRAPHSTLKKKNFSTYRKSCTCNIRPSEKNQKVRGTQKKKMRKKEKKAPETLLLRENFFFYMFVIYPSRL